jgi:hypothetical protein
VSKCKIIRDHWTVPGKARKDWWIRDGAGGVRTRSRGSYDEERCIGERSAVYECSETHNDALVLTSDAMRKGGLAVGRITGPVGFAAH